MASNEHQSPVPNHVRLKAIEIVGDLQGERSYFATISVDGSVAVETEKKKKYNSDPILRWQWQEELKFGVHPSSTIEIKVYRRSRLKVPLRDHHLIGEHTTKLIDLLEQNENTTLDLNAENTAVITPKIKLNLSLDPETNREFKDFMESINSSITRLEGNTIKIPSEIGTALQFTKNIMDIVSNAHPILKASWTVLSVVYDAVQKVELQDDAIRELAECLKELLAVANKQGSLLVIEGTENVVDEIGRMSLKVSSLIYEYAKPKFTRRIVVLQVSDNLRTRIADCRKSCDSLKERFDRRVNMETNQMVKEIKDDNNTMQRKLDTNEEKVLADKIWTWLSAPDSSPNYNAASEKYQAGTCDWVLTEGWLEDFLENAGFTWIKATAGCGKTVLCAFIIKKIIELCNKESSAASAYFFFDGRDAQKSLQFHNKLIRSLIRQLSDYCGGIPAALTELYQHYRGHQQAPTNELQDTLHKIIDTLGSVYIVIDLLDECVNGEKLLEWIQDIIQCKKENLHIIFASRPKTDIEDVLQDPGLGCSVVELVHKSNQGIEIYLEEHVAALANKKNWSIETEKAVKSSLLNGAEGMFHWVALQFSVLKKCPNEPLVLEQLKKLPRGLDKTYNQILSGIDEDYRLHVQMFLRWLCFSKRAMSLREIAETAAVDFNMEGGEPVFVASRRYKNERDVLEKCSGLATESEGNIKLAHFSVKEYLLSEQLRIGALSTFYLVSAELSHSIIAQTCLAYLLHFDSPDSLDEDFIESFPLAQYAAKYWIDHTRSATINESKVETSFIWILACKLFNPNGTTWINWVRIWDVQKWSDATPLYYASIIAVAPVVQHLLDNGAEVNLVGGEDGSALQATSGRGHTAIVELLLANGADVNLVGGRDVTALQGASSNGHTAIVDMLLKKGANANLLGGGYGSLSALQAASSKGYTAIVEMLLKKGADVNLVGGRDVTALQGASSNGHTAIVDMLLKKGADANLLGGYGSMSALLAASLDGHIAIVELLLANGADVNLVGGEYGSALQAASGRGHTAIVEMLLAKGANVNLVAGRYSSALQAASSKGDTAIVEMLLKKGANVNLVGGRGHSALQAASRWGYTEIVEMLLAKGGHVNLVGGEYGSALQGASFEGHTAIVEMLLAGGADVNWEGEEHGNALMAATAGGHDDIVKLLQDAQEAVGAAQSVNASGIHAGPFTA